MGFKQISGTKFHNDKARITAACICSLHPDEETKCILTDIRDFSSWPFHTVIAAKLFARRRRHGRTLEEHQRAERLLCLRETMKWTNKELAGKIGVSPRTVEAYFSGVRVVPERVMECLNSH